MVETRVIRRLLNPAVNLWLRSQVETAADLQFHLESSDRELLSGRIAEVTVAGQGVVYQGLHLSGVHLCAQTIHFNLGQVLRGKPFRLLDPLKAAGKLILFSTDLNASIPSQLLGTVLEELLDQWAASLNTLSRWQTIATTQHHWQDIHIDFEPDTLILTAHLVGLEPDPISLQLKANVMLENAQTIRLQHLVWDCPDREIATTLAPTETLQITIGSDAVLESLAITAGQVICEMKIAIFPA